MSKPAVDEAEVVFLDLDDCRYGTAIWGIVPPVYDSTLSATSRGIHAHLSVDRSTHSELSCGALYVKRHDWTRYLLLDTISASTYLATAVFDQKPQYLECPHCGQDHLDVGRDSVIPTQVHFCRDCGSSFKTEDEVISNPLMGLKERLGDPSCNRAKQLARQTLEISHQDFPGGIRLWGSNSAIIWTFSHREKEGIHIHCFGDDPATPILDTTVASVKIDGVALESEFVRYFMAQQNLQFLQPHLRNLYCENCRHPHFDRGIDALVPHSLHACEICGHCFKSKYKSVSNPILNSLRELYRLSFGGNT